MKKVLYYLTCSIAYLVSLLPLWVLYLLSDFIFLIIFYVMKYRRRLVFKNMSDSFPNKSEEEIRVLERRFYHWFCDYLVESIKLLTISKQQLKRRMVFRQHCQGRSVVCCLSGTLLQLGMDYLPTLMGYPRSPMRTDLSCHREQ